MPQRRARIAPSAAQSELAASLPALRPDIAGTENFDPAALAEAGSVPEPTPEIDLLDVPFATLDPVGSKDLDQAFHLERSGSGFVVRYAIADLPGFVIPEGAVDTAARERGQTRPVFPLCKCVRQCALLPRHLPPPSCGAWVSHNLVRPLTW